MPTPNQSGGFFTRYQGEQVPSLPAGYLEAAQAQASMYANIGAHIANGMQQYATNKRADEQAKLKTGENAINERKVAAAERANVIKEGVADTESTYKAYSAKIAADKDAFDRVEGSNKALDAQLTYFNNISNDPEKSQQEKEEAKKKILELTPLKKKALENYSRYLDVAPVTYEQFLADRSKAGQQRPPIRNPDGTKFMMQAPATPAKGDSSHYTSPEFNPAPITGEAQGVTKTVAFGGSSKKVELVGGRVSSVVSSKGEKAVLENYLPEEALAGATEFAGKFAGSPTTEEEPRTFASPEDAYTEVPGPLGETIIDTEGMKAITTSSTSSVPVNGTIIFEETKDSAGTITKTPRIKFNTRTLTNADGTENETGVRTLRQLTLINEVLKGGTHKLVKPTKEEMDSARDLFGTPENAFDLPQISAAWAVVKRNTDKTYKGYNSTANNFSMKFMEDYNMYPSQFLANGEQANQTEIIPDASVALEKTRAARLNARFADVGLAPSRPPGLTDSITYVDSQLKSTESKIAKLSGYLKDPSIIGSDVEKGYKNELAGEMKKLTLLEARAKQNQIVISNYDAEMKAFESRRNSVEQELKVDKLAQDIETGKIEQSKAVEKFAERWIGSEPQHLVMTNGFVASKLTKLKGKTGAIPLVNKFGEPIMTTDRFGNTVQKVYEDRLDAPEYLSHLVATRNYALITELSRGMPSDDNINNPKTGIMDAQFKYNESLKPLHELKSMNDKYIAMANSGKFGTGEVQAYWNKMWYEPQDATGTSYQKTLIGKIREAIVGPGNPSNYEQEVIASIVPNPTDFFTRPERQQARIRALATINILNHYNRMVSNKLEATPETFDMYTKQLGDVLGFPVTEAFFTGVQNDYMKSKNAYSNNERMNNENKTIAQDFGSRLLDTLESNIKSANEAKARKK